MATLNRAKVVDKVPKLGTSQIGAPADISILELVEGQVEFLDARNNRRQEKCTCGHRM